jgi:hypothetical protein
MRYLAAIPSAEASREGGSFSEGGPGRRSRPVTDGLAKEAALYENPHTGDFTPPFSPLFH